NEIGVQLTFKQVDATTLNAAVVGHDFVFDIGWGWSGYRPDPDQYLAILTGSKGSLNIANYNSALIDQLLGEERTTFKEGEGRAVFRKLADALNDDAVYLSYHFGSDFKVLSPKLKGFVHRQDGLARYDELTLG